MLRGRMHVIHVYTLKKDRSKLTGSTHPEVVQILKFAVLDPLNLAGEDACYSCLHIKKRQVGRSHGFHAGHSTGDKY